METLIGIAIGAIVVAVAPQVPILRGLSKAMVKGSISVVDKTKEVLSTTGENWSDLVAEARSELDESGHQAAKSKSGDVEVVVSEG